MTVARISSQRKIRDRESSNIKVNGSRPGISGAFWKSPPDLPPLRLLALVRAGADVILHRTILKFSHDSVH